MENEKENAFKGRSFNDTTIPLPEIISHSDDIASCRCGCVPKDLMSLFQMAELRAKHREKMRLKAESESEANNAPSVPTVAPNVSGVPAESVSSPSAPTIGSVSGN